MLVLLTYGIRMNQNFYVVRRVARRLSLSKEIAVALR